MDNVIRLACLLIAVMLSGAARADVACVAGMLDVAAPERPVIVPVSREFLAKRGAPTGWTDEAWARHAGGLFVPPSTIFLASENARGHELAHFVLYANGLPYSHDDPDADRKVAFVTRAFDGWCR